MPTARLAQELAGMRLAMMASIHSATKVGLSWGPCSNGEHASIPTGHCLPVAASLTGSMHANPLIWIWPSMRTCLQPLFHQL